MSDERVNIGEETGGDGKVVISLSDEEEIDSLSSSSEMEGGKKGGKGLEKKKKSKGKKKKRGKSVEVTDLLEDEHASKKKRLLFEGLIKHDHKTPSPTPGLNFMVKRKL
ncbi:uncharacterized protein MELLADRAFT_70114 [Melampsora larici-populina 98AG31]|uniref:Uncharacterized protein n=1 Tax=Melampsora larici-populina (strain 98AG31 / pathotype 3-4-7) TaxID=747676 RepID=F4SDM2_MELLP|nr:uncharacterized protein MELLADRAFT_70114 [Melampsora larici-populina 98AG31]EGF97254.1 hypothetical protein MELLADRAFT_70114 [Melampsora larici-populina 98AG31]